MILCSCPGSSLGQCRGFVGFGMYDGSSSPHAYPFESMVNFTVQNYLYFVKPTNNPAIFFTFLVNTSLSKICYPANPTSCSRCVAG